MNTRVPASARTPFEVVLFVLTCLGIFIALAGIIVTSKPAAIIGALLIGIGLTFFALRDEP